MNCGATGSLFDQVWQAHTPHAFTRDARGRQAETHQARTRAGRFGKITDWRREEVAGGRVPCEVAAGERREEVALFSQRRGDTENCSPGSDRDTSFQVRFQFFDWAIRPSRFSAVLRVSASPRKKNRGAPIRYPRAVRRPISLPISLPSSRPEYRTAEEPYRCTPSYLFHI